MKFYQSKYLPIIIGTACALGVWLGSFVKLNQTTSSFFTGNTKKDKLNRLIDYIDYEYVDEVDTDSIVDVTVNRILKNLDPHSTYIPAKKYAEVSENMQGDFVGIGVSFYRIQDTVAVIRPLPNSPAEKAGIKAGDRILYANNIALFNTAIGNDSLKKILKGGLKTKINLQIKRQETSGLLSIAVERDHIPIKSIDAAYMLNARLGYVKINRFSETTAQEFQEAAQALITQGATELCLDLRDNGGGYLDQAVKIADEFLPDNKLIVFTKNKNGHINKTYATADGSFENTKVFVLINENSASASEVIAGALQDNDIGTIVGRRSFGKGLVQREMDLGDGSAVRLTVARYYTPTGRSIQRSYANGSNAYFQEYTERYNNGELLHKDSIQVNDSLKFTTPKGKIVYGGGGIIPDVFIPKNTDQNKESLDYMLRGGVIDRFIFNKLEENRKYYNQLTLERFEKEVVVDEAMLVAYMDYLGQFGFDYQLSKYKPLLKQYLKATIALQLFGSNAAEKIINEHDPYLLKVIQLDTE